MLGVTAVVIGFLCVTLYAGEKGYVKWSPGFVLTLALILRLLFLFREPELSDDIYRYLLDGLQSLMGHNPYALTPASIEPATGEMARLIERINHPHLITIYPPAAQFVFAMGTALGGGVLGLKVLLVIMDMATCAMIVWMISIVRLPPWRATIYAWHPLPILEIAASGHIDGVGILFFFLTLILLNRLPDSRISNSPLISQHRHPKHLSWRRIILPLSAGITLAFAGLVKLFPLLFLPGCLVVLSIRNKLLLLMGVLIGAILFIFPFMPDARNALDTLIVYARNWEFANLAYRTIRRITCSGDVARSVLACGFLLIMAFSYGKLYLKISKPKQNNAAGPSLSPSRIQPLQADNGKEVYFSFMQALYITAMAYLLLTPVLHPWYALYLICFLPFVPGSAGLTLSWSVFLAYQVLIPYTLLGKWIENDTIPAMIWLAPVTVFFLAAMSKRVQRCEWISARTK